jgi:hypothetical protein
MFFNCRERQSNIKEIIESNVEQELSKRDLELSFVNRIFSQFTIFESINGLCIMNIKAASKNVFFRTTPA